MPANGKLWTTLEREQVRLLRTEGKAWKVIARLLGRSLQSVKRLGQRSGFCAQRRSREEIDHLVRAGWRRNLSPCQIRVETGCGETTIRASLARQGLPPRKPDLSKRWQAWKESTRLPSLAAMRRWKVGRQAAEEGFSGCRSLAELEVCRLLAERGPLSAWEVSSLRGLKRHRGGNATNHQLRRLCRVGLVVKVPATNRQGEYGPGIRWALAQRREDVG